MNSSDTSLDTITTMKQIFMCIDGLTETILRQRVLRRLLEGTQVIFVHKLLLNAILPVLTGRLGSLASFE